MAGLTDYSDASILLLVAIAMVLAGCIGWERESAGKAAGIRTHMLVGIGASLFVGLGDIIVRHASSVPGIVQADPVRVLEAIVTGISSLGAGMILSAAAIKSKD
jgi:putative Mg2+ transporter-C (MgtC) family protein